MPEFKPGEKTTARATLINPTAKQWTYEVELYLGVTKEATSGVGSITIAAGASQVVDLPVTMPSVEETYPVYLDVFVAGELLEHHRAAVNGVPEDVVIGVPVPLAPCVYCGATFTSEAALIDHMEGNHPGKPYLIYAYPAEAVVVSGGIAYINYKVGISDITTGYMLIFHFGLEGIYWLAPYACAHVIFEAGATAGYYEGSEAWYVKYMTDHFKFANIPPGVYRLLSTCKLYHLDGTYTLVKTYWSKSDTGLTITVV